MKAKFKITFLFSIFVISCSYLIHDTAQEKQRLDQVTKEYALSPKVKKLNFSYKESNNPSFYNTEELVGFLHEDMIMEHSKEGKQTDIDLIRSICPYVDIDGDSIVIHQKQNKKKLQLNSQSTGVLSSKSAYSQPTDSKALIAEMKAIAESCLGTPYVWGGETKGVGMDCSGFVQYVYKQLGFTLPRHSSDQSKIGKLVKRTELKPGDLLFFDTKDYRTYQDVLTPEEECAYAEAFANGSAPDMITHVGLYMGNGMMIHAPDVNQTVKYESINTDYYKVRFINARRLIR